MKPGIYSLKKEFAPMLGIPNNQIDRRKEELYEWLKNFFVFELLDGVPIRIHIKEIIGEYQPLPRKKYTVTDAFLINHLGLLLNIFTKENKNDHKRNLFI